MTPSTHTRCLAALLCLAALIPLPALSVTSEPPEAFLAIHCKPDAFGSAFAMKDPQGRVGGYVVRPPMMDGPVEYFDASGTSVAVFSIFDSPEAKNRAQAVIGPLVSQFSISGPLSCPATPALSSPAEPPRFLSEIYCKSHAFGSAFVMLDKQGRVGGYFTNTPLVDGPVEYFDASGTSLAVSSIFYSPQAQRRAQAIIGPLSSTYPVSKPLSCPASSKAINKEKD